jgi:glutamate-1-semialdehyde aminotransferase
LTSLAYRMVEDLDKINDEIRRRRYGRRRDRHVAAIIVEPEGKSPSWLKTLRMICDANEVLLIFDEIITGFRWDIGGYQKHADVIPDLACFGKSMANGMPISALVGKKEYMQRCAPPDNIFFSTTFGGETLSIAAALATIKFMQENDVVTHIWNMGAALSGNLKILVKDYNLDHVITIHGDAPRVHVKMSDQMRGVWVKAMIDSGTLIINCNNMSWPFGHNEMKHLHTCYLKAFEAIRSWLHHGAPEVAPVRMSLVR